MGFVAEQFLDRKVGRDDEAVVFERDGAAFNLSGVGVLVRPEFEVVSEGVIFIL